MASYRLAAVFAALASGSTAFTQPINGFQNGFSCTSFSSFSTQNKCSVFAFPAAPGTHFTALPHFKEWTDCSYKSKSILRISSSSENINFNSVYVPKEGGPGLKSASEMMGIKGAGRSLGAPPPRPPRGGTFVTHQGITVDATVRELRYTHGDFDVCAADEDCDEYVSSFFKEGNVGQNLVWGSDGAIERLVDLLDHRRGAVLTSGYEFPGRYARWSLGFVDPPLEISGTGNHCTVTALNARGRVLMNPVYESMDKLLSTGILSELTLKDDVIALQVAPPAEVGTFSEEERSKQPSLFSVVRALVDLFGYDSDESGDLQLGLYGAFGYDLTFQFEPIRLSQQRDPSQRDLLLYLADEIVVVDQSRHSAWTVSLDFTYGSETTKGLPHEGASFPFLSFDEHTRNGDNFSPRDTPKGDFTKSVDRAKQEFKVGNLFEAVLSQTFRKKLDKDTTPSELFRRLRARNPSPYGFFFNLGEEEYLVGASPEMFVRCEKVENNEYRPGALRVETCPISGTVARGVDALEDAQRVKSLIMNLKEESELTMCTDVDRNDKSRICEPGSVKVIGRRQIEMYSRLIHTVDHVEGYLRPKFDALDAFLCHTWAVTVTGAPKTWAIQFVEDNERSPRCWYGGAVGLVGFDGSMNTGLTLRTVRVKNGVAEVRAGATLLYDSEPEAEEKETELKASAMLDAIDSITEVEIEGMTSSDKGPGDGKTIILIDHEDSFVHTLGNYLRQTGAHVTTLRSGPSALRAIQSLVDSGNKPDMVVLSPGPGNPSDFELSKSLSVLEHNKIPGFGVCLGLQGMVEYFGGELGVLDYPMHGKPSPVKLTQSGKEGNSIFAGLPESFEVARYHSLHGILSKLPSCLDVTALTEDGIVMGIKHKTLPFAAVQFHPESILTSPAKGMKILENALSFLVYEGAGHENGESLDAVVESEEIILNKIDRLPVATLKNMLRERGMSAHGVKADLIVKLALQQLKAQDLAAGNFDLTQLTVPELRELKASLGVKGTAPNKAQLILLLNECLQS